MGRIDAYLENGIPSHDGIARVMARIPASEMTDCFIAWVKSVADLTEGEVVAIDGKTLRRSYNKKDGSVARTSESEERLVFRHNYPAKAINCL